MLHKKPSEFEQALGVTSWCPKFVTNTLPPPYIFLSSALHVFLSCAAVYEAQGTDSISDGEQANSFVDLAKHSVANL
jgi:hypothetical protein